MPTERIAVQYEAAEWPLLSGRPYEDPFNDVTLDVILRGPEGTEWRVPAFWAGGNEWRVRFAPPLPGDYGYHVECSDAENALHGQQGTLHAAPYAGDNDLLARGPLTVKETHLAHADGTPFLWLGDTWWMGFCERLRWPDDFQLLTADRREKGFSVIHLVAGLYPDMPAFDPRGANEAGFPWEEGWARINPAYFDAADLRVRWLVKNGLAPMIVGAWGYYLPLLGIEKMKQHWRYLIARWGAYPVIWCLAGEGAMPYYLSETREDDIAFQKAGWSEVGHYVRATDPYHRPITIHPTDTAYNQIDDPDAIDFNLLQVGHSPYHSPPHIPQKIIDAVASEPHTPVINSEGCYEGIMEGNRQEVQRFQFWTCLLSGGAGFSYGANGIWQFNSEDAPYGPSPHGMAWGDTPWQEAYKLPGSAHVGLAKRFLERYPWPDFEPHREWVEFAGAEAWAAPYAAGTDDVRMIYFTPFDPIVPWRARPLIKALKGVYKAAFFDPTEGSTLDLGEARPDSDGAWEVPIPPIMKDWVLVLEKV